MSNNAKSAASSPESLPRDNLKILDITENGNIPWHTRLPIWTVKYFVDIISLSI